jgi:hypothetical protein
MKKLIITAVAATALLSTAGLAAQSGARTQAPPPPARAGGGDRGNGADELTISRILENDPGMPVMRKIIDAYERGYEPSPEQAAGWWLGFYYIRHENGEYVPHPVIFRVHQRDLGQVGRMTLTAFRASPEMNMDMARPDQIGGQVELEINRQLNQIEESRISVDGQEWVRNVRAQIWTRQGNSATETAQGLFFELRLKMFSSAIVGVLDPKDAGAGCRPYTLGQTGGGHGIWAIEAVAEGRHCGALILYRKL